MPCLPLLRSSSTNFPALKPAIYQADNRLYMHVNFEFKARSSNHAELEERLLPFAPDFRGTDHQVDTYFHVPNGRLKLREGSIEYALIHYIRSDSASAKQSDVLLYQPAPDPGHKQILSTALGIKVVVDKQRRIYFIDNVKFHFDTVSGLGSFIEVEAIDYQGSIGLERLQEQCAFYARLFGIREQDYEAGSYSDLLLAKKSTAY